MVSTVFTPGKAMRKALGSRRPLRRAALALAVVGLAYIVTSAVLAVAGAVPTAPVFFGLDVDNYYVWQMAFALPLVFAAGLLAAGAVWLFGRRDKSGPDFAGIVGLSAAAVVSPFFLAWVPSAVEAFFLALGMGQVEWVSLLSEPGPWQTAYLAVYAAAAALALRNFTLAARLGRKKLGAGEVAGGFFAAALAVGSYILFIR